MRTVGRKVPKNRNHRGVFVALCDVCDARYYDTQLVRKEDGTLLCLGPGTLNCGRGRVAVTLDRQNAEGAKYDGQPLPDGSRLGGRFDGV